MVIKLTLAGTIVSSNSHLLSVQKRGVMGLILQAAPGSYHIASHNACTAIQHVKHINTSFLFRLSTCPSVPSQSSWYTVSPSVFTPNHPVKCLSATLWLHTENVVQKTHRSCFTDLCDTEDWIHGSLSECVSRDKEICIVWIQHVVLLHFTNLA